MYNYQCEECSKGTVKKTVIKNYEVKIFEKPFIVPTATIGLCNTCGSFNYDGKEMHRWKDLYTAWEAKSEDYLSPQKIQKIRKSLLLNQSEFAAFIGVSRQSLSVWENDKRPSVQPQSVDILLQMLFSELSADNKPVTAKMVEKYNNRTSHFIKFNSKTETKSTDKNSVLKNILPKSTWTILKNIADKNNTDPITEAVLSIELKAEEFKYSSNNFLENYLIEWSNKPTNIYDYRTTEYKISKIANYPGAVSEKKIKYGT